MSLWPPIPPPPTKLGVYRVLSPNAGIRVSPLQLGGMSIGEKWKDMGSMNKESSFKLLNAYYDAGVGYATCTYLILRQQYYCRETSLTRLISITKGNRRDL